VSLLEDIVGLREYLIKLESNKQYIETSIVQQEKELDELKLKHLELTKQAALDVKSSVVIQQIFDSVSNSGFRFLEQLLNQALAYVFPDRDFTINIKTGVRGSEKTVELFLHDGICENPLAECSGAVNTVVSVTLQVYYIIKNDLRRFIVFDESFGALHNRQLEYFMSYLKTLEKDLGFTFVWITQNQLVTEYTTDVYELSFGKAERLKS
jgi:hypothetical protein